MANNSARPGQIGPCRRWSWAIWTRARGKRHNQLESWFEQGISRIECLPWDSTVGMRWAQLLADLRRSGKPMSIKDNLIAATALTHELALVTLNRRDFEPARVQLVDPSS